MDELDHNLLMAWNRVFERCRNDPLEARRRYLRTLPGTHLDRAHRDWCVVVRASDTRFLRHGAVCDRGAFDRRARHDVVLDGGLFRELGGPVWLRYPGVPLDAAAGLLGKHRESMRKWLPIRPGRSRVGRAALGQARGLGKGLDWQEVLPGEGDGVGVLGVRYEPAGLHGRRGMAVPVVWSEGALDPCGDRGRPASRWWGSMWMGLADRIPQGFEQVVERVPRFVRYRDEGERFRGWLWRCEGLADGGGCGQLVSKLYAPLPVWTVGRAFGVEQGLRVAGVKGRWLPGVMDRWAGRRRLACEFCWRLRWSTFVDDTGWGDLVSHLSGGLLYGKEVQKPADFEHERKRVYRKRGVAVLNACHVDAATASPPA